MNKREIMNTLATMPEHSKATICGVRIERFIFGYRVEDGNTMHPRGAAKVIARLAAERERPPK